MSKLSTPTAVFEEWTPRRAEEVFAEQQRQGYENPRNLRPSRIAFYARQMESGHWHLNGAAVCFNGARLLDGWHRLNAIIKSGTSQRLLTVRGISAEAVPSIDTGLQRSAGDVLFGAGVANANRVAAAARTCWLYQTYRDVRPSKGWPSNEDVITFVQNNPELASSAAWAKPLSAFGSPATIAAWHFLCGQQRPVERDAFFADLADGVALKPGQPVLVLRETLMRNRANRMKFPSFMISAYIIKAWNFELEGRTISLLKFSQDEKFPILL